LEPVIALRDGVGRRSRQYFSRALSFELNPGEQLALVGNNGAGKTTLVNLITGADPLVAGTLRYGLKVGEGRMLADELVYVGFLDAWGSMAEGGCYQLRWNHHEWDEQGGRTVADFLGKLEGEDALQIVRVLDLERLLPEHPVVLSSGEMRRMQLAKVLLGKPQVVIVDEPFIGLDPQMRRDLEQVLHEASERLGIQFVFVVSKQSDVPAFVNRVVELEGKSAFSVSLPKMEKDVPRVVSSANSDEEVIGLRHIYIKYGVRTVFDDFSLSVKRGEHWCIRGRNGAGKSTLLSLICGDHLQCYANDVRLFGKRYGQGVSVWEVKRRIGYVSPEMHRSYLRNVPVVKVLASGLHDTIGLYGGVKPEDVAACERWLQVAGLADRKDGSFLSLSSGEQRLVLVLRAFIKDPELLILDEPMQGLDEENRELVKRLIAAYCQNPQHTLLMVGHDEKDFPTAVNKRLEL